MTTLNMHPHKWRLDIIQVRLQPHYDNCEKLIDNLQAYLKGYWKMYKRLVKKKFLTTHIFVWSRFKFLINNVSLIPQWICECPVVKWDHKMTPFGNFNNLVGSISAALSCLVYPGRSAGSFPEQRLVIEPNSLAVQIFTFQKTLR